MIILSPVSWTHRPVRLLSIAFTHNMSTCLLRTSTQTAINAMALTSTIIVNTIITHYCSSAEGRKTGSREFRDKTCSNASTQHSLTCVHTARTFARARDSLSDKCRLWTHDKPTKRLNQWHPTVRSVSHSCSPSALLGSHRLRYNSGPVSTGNTFQDLPLSRDTTDNTEYYIQRDIRITYINTVKLNWYITYSKTLPALNEVIIMCTVHYCVYLQCTFCLSLSVHMKERDSDVLA